MCNVDLKIPRCRGTNGIKEENISIVAVFDGHGGSEASEMASWIFLDKFPEDLRRTEFQLYGVSGIVVG